MNRAKRKLKIVTKCDLTPSFLPVRDISPVAGWEILPAGLTGSGQNYKRLDGSDVQLFENLTVC